MFRSLSALLLGLLAVACPASLQAQTSQKPAQGSLGAVMSGRRTPPVHPQIASLQLRLKELRGRRAAEQLAREPLALAAQAIAEASAALQTDPARAARRMGVADAALTLADRLLAAAHAEQEAQAAERRLQLQRQAMEAARAALERMRTQRALPQEAK